MKNNEIEPNAGMVVMTSLTACALWLSIVIGVIPTQVLVVDDKKDNKLSVSNQQRVAKTIDFSHVANMPIVNGMYIYNNTNVGDTLYVRGLHGKRIINGAKYIPTIAGGQWRTRIQKINDIPVTNLKQQYINFTQRSHHNIQRQK